MQPVCVVMPAKNESLLIAKSIESIPAYVDWVIVVDDGSSDNTGEIAKEMIGNRGSVLRTNGLGVGGAIAVGSQAALEIDERDWIVVVMAGDGQMDSCDIPALIAPIQEGRADHVKGNRFIHRDGPIGMPLIRRIGTWWLSKLTSLASGIKLGDTQCGFTATSRNMLETWDWSRTWEGYGYPNWWLMEAGRRDFRIAEVPVKSVYGDEDSGIRLVSFLPTVSWMLWKGVWRRGVDWYITGTKSSLSMRVMANGLWFGAWASLFLSFSWPVLALAAPVAFAMLTKLDRKEGIRRRERGAAIEH